MSTKEEIDTKKQIKETYDRIADDWDNTYADTMWWVDGKDAFISFLKPTESVLDVGCGSGKQAIEFKQAGLKVTGFDISPRMIALAQKNVPPGKFLVMDMENMEFGQEKFDGIYVQAALLHLRKKSVKTVFKNLVNYLKKDGYIYVAVKQQREAGPEEEIKVDNDFGYEFERFFSYFTPQEIKGLFSENNLTPVWEEIKHSGRSHWIQCIGKKNYDT